MSQSNSNIPPRMTALGLLEQMRRANAANREPEFNSINAISAMRRAGPTAPLFGGQRQPPLPIPPRPPAVIPPPPQRAAPQAAGAPQARTPAQALPVPPRPPQLGADGNPIPPAVLPQVPGAEPQPLYARFNPENPYVATATQMAERYGLPPNVFLSLVHQESRFRPDAVSPRGATGLGQLMPGTASDMRVDPLDPIQNLEGSARYLRQQLDRFGGDMTLALAAYNAGPRRVAEAGNTIPNNAETRAYVPEVLRNAGVPGYAEGGLAKLEHKYAEGGPVALLPTYDIDVRATRIPRRRAPRPAPREELTADQLNGMVLDILARRAAAEPEAGAAAEARERIGRTMGYAEGGLADLHQKYADGGEVMSDEEYDRRLLGRMQRDMGRTDVPSWDEQRATLVDAAGRAARGVFDVVVPQTPLDVGLTLATGPVGSMARRGAIAGAGYLLDPDEAQANVIRRVGRALGRAGAGSADTALEAAATPTAPTRRRGTIGIIPEETAPAARVTQDVEGYRPNIDPVTGRAILPAAEDLLAAPRSDFPYLDVPQPSNPRQSQALLAEQQNMTPGTGNTYSGNMDPLVNERVIFRGREPREWSPSDWGAYGRQYGTDRLGPVDDAAWQSSLREYDAGGGQRISIPGGLDSTEPFTYYDQLFLKSQGIDPSQMPRDMHIALQRRILNSVTPDADDPVAAYNGLMMGFASPNNPLFPNQIAMTRLRARSPEDIERLADMLPWRAGDDVSKADRAAFNRRIAEVYGLDAGPQAAVTAREAIPRVPGRRAREAVLDENGRVIRPAQSARAAREAKPAREAEEATIGGTGARGSPDYTRIAEFAQMYRDRPDFFRFNPDPNLSNSENWSRFVERIVSQVPGLSAKTGSFGAVWQQPATAAISAIDRHMANQIGSRIFPDRQALDKFNERVITKWNSGLTPAQRKTDRVSDIEELTNNDRGNTFLQSELLNAVGQHSGMRVRNPRGGLNPDLPSHLTPEEANWVREPRNVATLGSHYREALSENARMAEQEGLGLFGSQWLNWDRIRRRLEPHENMNPVLSRIPPMALEQLQDARLTHRAMGSTNYTKVRPTAEQEAAALRAGDNVNASPRLLPTSRVANPSGLGYFAVPPLVAGSLAREGEPAPSLEELDDRYAKGGRVVRRYAHGGLAQLHHKYAEGGAVSAQPAIYDPDAVNALANQIEADYV